MSWFTKKKDSDDKQKKSSVLAIETMQNDLEHTEKEEKKEKKPLKKSPFLTEQKTEKETDEKDNTKKEEETPIAESNQKKENPVFPTEEDDSEKTKKENFSKSAPHTEEDKMEKLVKVSDLKPKNKKMSKKKEKISDKKSTRKLLKKEISVFPEIKKENKKIVLPIKQTPHELAKNNLNKSPFGVPKKGITIVSKEKIAKQKKAKQEEEKKVNKPLLIFAVIIFILTLTAIGYNYYRNTKVDSPIKTPPMVIKEEPTEPAYTTDNFADAAVILQTSKELLLTDLKKFIKKEKELDPNKFSNGVFIRPLQNEAEYITGEEVLKIFNSQDFAINSFLDKPVVIFATEEEVDIEEILGTIDKNQKAKTATLTEPAIVKKKVIKLSLLLELKKDSRPGDVIERMTEIETTFPGTLKSLMIEESVSLVNEKIVFSQATQEKRDLVHVSRYFNFKSGNITQSIEWGSLLYKNKSYIFFTTSKASTESLLKGLF